LRAPSVCRTWRRSSTAGRRDFANAGLLRADDGWRAVVLPSMGDLAADLGDGPLAIRPDGRRVAVVHDGALYELEIPGMETTQVETPATPGAVVYDASGALRCAYGAGVDRQDDGSPITDLAASASAPRLAAVHEDGSISVWDGDEHRAAFAAPVDAPRDLGVTADGDLLTMAGTVDDEEVVCVVRADGGTLIRRIEGARTIAPMPDGVSVLIGGDWGMMLLEPPREA